MVASVDAATLRARARVGTTLKGKYLLDDLIGGGGMASVYSATHRNSKRFAVKMLHPELSAHEDLRVRFMREGYVANQVGHPGALAVIDDDVTDDGAAFLVMELLDGESLQEIADHRGKLTARVVLGMAYQLLDVLIAADQKGIVHRDIKPANLFVTRQGQLKVLDFGVARMKDAQGALTTHAGHTLGTPAYMSPEQALGRADEIDARTDLWAVGATMFGLLSGHLVHEASTGQEQMVFAATKQARTLADVGADAPMPVVAIVDKALAFRREDRWESAAAMRAAVGLAYESLYGESASNAALGALVSPMKLAVLPPTSPSDPLAPTARADAVVSDKPRVAQEVIETKPFEGTKSLAVAATTESRRARAARTATVAVGASLLVVVGVAIGAWAMRSPPSATAPNATTPSADRLPLPVPSAVPPPSASPAASASVVAPAVIAPPPGTGTATVAKPKVKPTSAASASSSRPHDSFDRQ